MLNQIPITGGPSVEELFLSLRLVDEVRQTTFTLSVSNQIFERIPASVCMLRSENSSAELWSGEIYFQPGKKTTLSEKLVYILYTGKKRKGILTDLEGLQNLQQAINLLILHGNGVWSLAQHLKISEKEVIDMYGDLLFELV